MPETDSYVKSENPEFQPLLDHFVSYYNEALEERLSKFYPSNYYWSTHGIFSSLFDHLITSVMVFDNYYAHTAIDKQQLLERKITIPPILLDKMVKFDELINKRLSEFHMSVNHIEILKQIAEFQNMPEVKNYMHELRNIRGVFDREYINTRAFATDEFGTIDMSETKFNQVIFDRIMVEQTVNLFRKIKNGTFNKKENSRDRQALSYCFKCSFDHSGYITGQTQSLGIVNDMSRTWIGKTTPPPNTVEMLNLLASEMVGAIIDGTPVTYPWLVKCQKLLGIKTLDERKKIQDIGANDLGLEDKPIEKKSYVNMSNRQRIRFFNNERKKLQNFIASGAEYDLEGNFKNSLFDNSICSTINESKQQLNELLENESNLLKKYNLTGVDRIRNGWVFRRNAKFEAEKKHLLMQRANVAVKIIAAENHTFIENIDFDFKSNSFVVHTLDKEKPYKVFSIVFNQPNLVEVTDKNIANKIVFNAHIEKETSLLQQKIDMIEEKVNSNSIHNFSAENKNFMNEIKEYISLCENNKHPTKTEMECIEELNIFLSVSKVKVINSFDTNYFTINRFKSFQKELNDIAKSARKNYLNNNHTISRAASRAFAGEFLKNEISVENETKIDNNYIDKNSKYIALLTDTNINYLTQIKICVKAANACEKKGCLEKIHSNEETQSSELKKDSETEPEKVDEKTFKEEREDIKQPTTNLVVDESFPNKNESKQTNDTEIEQDSIEESPFDNTLKKILNEEEQNEEQTIDGSIKLNSDNK